MTRYGRRSAVALLATMGLLLAACSGDDGATTTTAPAETTAPAPEEPAPDVEAPDTTVDDEPEDTAVADSTTTEPADTTTTEPVITPASWEQVVPGGDCECSDGTEFSFFVREADPEKVVLYFQGGGACFNEFTCDPATATYKIGVFDGDDPTNAPTGIFDFDDPRNPIADWSVVFVPYCTGDVHIGNNVMEYSDTVTVRHKGFVNGSAAFEHLADRFPSASRILVSGESAGSIPSPLFGGLMADRYPDADITVLGDGSGGYPDAGPVNAFIGALWGTQNAVPDWPVNEGMTADEWSIPGLYEQAGRHAPQLRMARVDFAYDSVQEQFTTLAGLGGDGLLDTIDLNDERHTSAGVDLFTYTAPGTEHTVLRRPAFYSLEVDGVLLHEWVSALLAGDDVPDVRCSICR